MSSSAESKPTLFLIGVGFIGGTLLTQLLDEKKYTISALTRRDEQVSVLESLGVRPVKGALDSHDVIANEVASTDIVIHTATADDQPSVKAVLDGLRKRTKGKAAVYIQTSGTGELVDDGKNEVASSKIFSDLKNDQVDALPESAPHRDVDLLIKNAVESGELEGKAKVAIMMPPLIYGLGDGPFNKSTIQIPTWVRESIEAKKVTLIGQGKSIWNNISVQVLCSGYRLLLSSLLDSERQPDPLYCFAETGEHAWLSIAEEIHKQLRQRGLVEGEIEKGAPAGYMGSNSRSKADRLRQLGWPGKEEEGVNVWKSIGPEVDHLLEEDKKKNGKQ